jgi:hypothetical protein
MQPSAIESIHDIPQAHQPVRILAAEADRWHVLAAWLVICGRHRDKIQSMALVRRAVEHPRISFRVNSQE